MKPISIGSRPILQLMTICMLFLHVTIPCHAIACKWWYENVVNVLRTFCGYGWLSIYCSMPSECKTGSWHLQHLHYKWKGHHYSINELSLCYLLKLLLWIQGYDNYTATMAVIFSDSHMYRCEACTCISSFPFPE